MPKLLIAASGTGGHIYPGLVVADSLDKSYQITWLGVPNRLEVDLVPKGYCLQTISVEGLQGVGLQRFVQGVKLLLSTFFVCKILRKKNIQIVFTTGGYIAAPTILAARLCGVPVIIHEANSIPGRVTRLLGFLCNRVALGFSGAEKFLPRCKTVFTGTPVRKDFFLPHDLPDWVPESNSPLILVMGGSQGAVKLNQMVRLIAPSLLEKGCRIVHLTGKYDAQFPNNKNNNLYHKNYIEKTFSNEIPSLLQHADLVISRAGASAISEFSITGTPAILIPFPYATDNHQEKNASFLAEAAAAIIVKQNSTKFKNLQNILLRLIDDSNNSIDGLNETLSNMSKAMRMIGVRDANEKIVDLIKSYT